MTGSPDNVTTTSVTQLTDEQRELIDLAMPGLRGFAANPPQSPSFATTVPFNAQQEQGQQMALDAAGGQAALAGQGAGASNFLLSGDVLNPASNPGLQGAIDAAVRPLTQEYQSTVLPSIRNEAVGAGQLGSSRQGVAEGIASRALMSQIGDTTSNIVNENYQAGLDAQGRALGLLPQTIGAQVAPALTTSGVGDVRQGQAQTELADQVARYNYEQLLPLLVAQDLVGLSSGIPGGGTSTTSPAPYQSPISSGLGGASLGATIGSVIPGVGTVAGAAAGGGLGLLLSLL